jgi:DsbC/DsbD-like thiol-disulfide interchange protein
MKSIRSLRVAILCCLLFTFAACTHSGENPTRELSAAESPAQRITSESVVRVAAHAVDFPAGGSGEANITLTIQNGYHVNANPPTFPYLKATELVIPAAEGVSVSFITYPTAQEKKFPFADKPLAVYEGETIVKATLKADKTATPGQRSISAQLRIQACDDQVCYAPGTLPLAIPVNIR